MIVMHGLLFIHGYIYIRTLFRLMCFLSKVISLFWVPTLQKKMVRKYRRS